MTSDGMVHVNAGDNNLFNKKNPYEGLIITNSSQKKSEKSEWFDPLGLGANDETHPKVNSNWNIGGVNLDDDYMDD